MSAPNTPPTGTGAGKVPSPPGRGAQIHLVRDNDASLLSGLFCLHRFTRDRWCLRVLDHAGGHVAYGPFPRTDISDANPRYRKATR